MNNAAENVCGCGLFNQAFTNLLPDSCFTKFLISSIIRVLETTEVGSPARLIISSISFGVLERRENIFFSWEFRDKLLGSFGG
jgi:hypothetical protein